MRSRTEDLLALYVNGGVDAGVVLRLVDADTRVPAANLTGITEASRPQTSDGYGLVLTGRSWP
jgi:hypothetical protein